MWFSHRWVLGLSPSDHRRSGRRWSAGIRDRPSVVAPLKQGCCADLREVPLNASARERNASLAFLGI